MKGFRYKMDGEVTFNKRLRMSYCRFNGNLKIKIENKNGCLLETNPHSNSIKLLSFLRCLTRLLLFDVFFITVYPLSPRVHTVASGTLPYLNHTHITLQ